MDRLILLGQGEGGIGVLMDIGCENNGIKTFEIVKNIDKPNCEFEPQIYIIRYFKDSEYNFKNNSSEFVQF